MATRRQQRSKKKLVIKPFKKKPKLPDDFEARTWSQLQTSVRAVYEKKPVSSSREQLYRGVEDLCIHKKSASLYTRLQVECDAQVAAVVASLVGQTPDHGAFLARVEQTWSEHCTAMTTIRNIFLYLDRTYVLQSGSARSIWDMGLQLFCKHLSRFPEVEQKTIQAVLSMVDGERRGESIPRSLMKGVIRMFLALKRYDGEVVPRLLTATTAFYRAEGERLMQEMLVPNYLVHVDSRLAQEEQRVVAYLDSATRPALVCAVEAELLRRHTSALLEKGFKPMMDGGRDGDLSRLHRLLGRVEGVDALRDAWALYVKEQAAEIVHDTENDKSMVESLLALHARLHVTLAAAFRDSEPFGYALKKSFETALNSRSDVPSELIAKFLDSKLRTGKGADESDMEALLDRVLVLFRFLTGKDVFEAFYKKDLAKRLLLGKSSSFDLERAMLAKLKAECGSEFTGKLEGMFRDIELSKDSMASFSQMVAESEEPPAVDASVTVLTTGFWPAYPPMDIPLPPQLASVQSVFQTFYLSKFNGRKLQWQHSLGRCVVKAAFSRGRKELEVSTFQTVVLLLFNGADTLPFADIKENTGIEDGELRRTLQSLACGKYRVLKKRPKSKEVADTDVFHFSADFKHRLFRIKINSIQMKETKKEKKDTHERVVKDRQYQIDAAIVRIMKARKVLTHALLMAELYTQLRFAAEPADLKRRIESLLDREYLERDENEAGKYHYLA